MPDSLLAEDAVELSVLGFSGFLKVTALSLKPIDVADELANRIPNLHVHYSLIVKAHYTSIDEAIR